MRIIASMVAIAETIPAVAKEFSTTEEAPKTNFFFIIPPF
jgi:hypothetical protein